jgi:hypothetical protein
MLAGQLFSRAQNDHPGPAASTASAIANSHRSAGVCAPAEDEHRLRSVNHSGDLCTDRSPTLSGFADALDVWVTARRSFIMSITQRR